VVGYWPWELTELGRNWAHAYDMVDEIWVASRFLDSVFKAETEKPVHLMPMLVDVSQTSRVTLEPYGIAPGDFVFLAMFDFNSTITRKNPLGIINAFRAAFPDGETDVKLLIKTTHAEQQAEAWSTVDAAIGDDERIVVVDGAMDRAEVCGLIAAASCFVSLHRSEGFGRVLAEAMALVTPVIATDWSGSRDYLSQQTGFPVRCTLRRVQEDEYPQAAGSWADPDTADAARHMRRLREQPSIASARVALGQRVIAAKYGIDAVSTAVLTRLRDMIEDGLAPSGNQQP
jgi:glycosyltransferase involved in cell wall biosynthesis